MKKAGQLAKKAITKAMNTEMKGWPPVCIGIIYQPARPKKSQKS